MQNLLCVTLKSLQNEMNEKISILTEELNNVKKELTDVKEDIKSVEMDLWTATIKMISLTNYLVEMCVISPLEQKKI